MSAKDSGIRALVTFLTLVALATKNNDPDLKKYQDNLKRLNNP